MSQENEWMKTAKGWQITFTDGHYAVWFAKDEKHARERAAETYPHRTVKSVNPNL